MASPDRTASRHHAGRPDAPVRHARRPGADQAPPAGPPAPTAPPPATSGGEPETPPVGVRDVFRRFWPYTRGHRAQLALGTLLVLASVPLETVAIWLFKILVDQVLQPANFGPFPRIAGAYVGFTVLMGALSFAAGQTMLRVSTSFVLKLRTGVFQHLHTLSMDFFDSRRLGDLMSRIGGDVDAVESLVLSGVSSAVTSVLSVIVYGVMLVVVDPLLAGAALILSPLLWVIGRVFSHRLKDTARQSRRNAGALSSVAEESLSTVSLVQAYNRQADEVRRYRIAGEAVVKAALRASRLRGLYHPLVELVELAGIMLVIGVGAWQMSRHEVTLGSLLVFLAYFSQMYSPLRSLGSLGNSFQSATAGAERILEVMDAQPSVPDHPFPQHMHGPAGYVEFRDVSFTYPGRRRPALDRVSFAARPGQLVAVVGRSGSGKSTLGRLLLRFYDPAQGAVLLGGQDLANLRLDDVREAVAVLMQETLVMDGTIRENVLWGRPDATPADLDRAVRAADLDSVVAELADGLETRVGYRGRRLSGGQRQRVAIARAMIRDAPVLLLDEPATGLDVAAERRVMEPLRRLMHGRTTILISHNLLAVRDADLIVVLDRGRVVETGTHEELFARGGHYYALCVAQRPFDLAELGGRPGDLVGGPRVNPGQSADIYRTAAFPARAAFSEGTDPPSSAPPTAPLELFPAAPNWPTATSA